MKKLVTLIFSASLIVSFAQEVKVTSSPEIANQNQTATWSKALGQDETGFYILKEFGSISNASVVLEKFSPKFELLFSTSIESTSGTFNDSKLHRYTTMKNGKVYVFLVGWSKAKQQNSFHVREVNEDGSLSDRTFELETEPATGQMKSANYSYSFSPDGSKLLVLTDKPFNKGAKESLRLQVFNTDDFSSIWKKDLTLENESDRFDGNQIIVDNQGTAFLLKDVRISNKEHVYQLITTGKDFSTLSGIDLQGYGLGQRKLNIDAAGNLLVAGTLVPAGRRNTDSQATWFFKANSKGEVLMNKVEALGKEMLSLVVSEKSAEKEGYVLDNQVVKDVLLKEDGGIILLLEEQRETKTVIPQSVPPVYEYTLFYGNVLAISMDATGNRVYNAVIEKNQTERSLDSKVVFGSFAYQLKNDKLHVVWNYTQVLTDPPLNKFRYWKDKSGAKINIDNLYGLEAFYPTMLTVLDAHGNFDYRDRTFNSLPLVNIQKGNSFPMAVNPMIFFATDKGMVILSRMPGIEAKRYKFSSIAY
ncbi:MAG: hypothetical protein PHQ74_03255 [Crocinitomicaceae bacterium]|nr:hypothetical protein [Crocinitomicaceae bacterium]